MVSKKVISFSLLQNPVATDEGGNISTMSFKGGDLFSNRFSSTLRNTIDNYGD